jgi:type II secretory pathway pseudopilin PulG
MFMLAILVIAMAVAAPRIRKSIQRDREVETMHRGKQYARAVKLYYKKFGAYPPSVDALVKTNEIRFLRRKYIDPTTGKDEWKPIHLGQNKAPTAMGFFGVPLTGTGMGGGGLCGNALPSSIPSSGSSTSIFSSNTSGGGFGSSSPTSGCPTDSSGSGSAATTDPNATGSATDTSAGGSTSTSGTGGIGTSTSGAGTGAGLTGQTLGGAGIIGFSPMSPKQSILVYKKKNHYNEWEFVYDPISDQMTMQGGNAGALGQQGSPGMSPTGSSTPISPSSSDGSQAPAPGSDTPTTQSPQQ